MDSNLCIRQILFSIIFPNQYVSNPAQSHNAEVQPAFGTDSIANYSPTMAMAVLTCPKVKAMHTSSSAINHKPLSSLTCLNTTILFYKVLNRH